VRHDDTLPRFFCDYTIITTIAIIGLLNYTTTSDVKCFFFPHFAVLHFQPCICGTALSSLVFLLSGISGVLTSNKTVCFRVKNLERKKETKWRLTSVPS